MKSRKGIDPAIGRSIRTRRQSKNMTRRQLADRVQVSEKTISNWENGIYAPHLDQLPKLSDGLSCSQAELLRLDEVAEECVRQYQRVRDICADIRQLTVELRNQPDLAIAAPKLAERDALRDRLYRALNLPPLVGDTADEVTRHAQWHNNGRKLPPTSLKLTIFHQFRRIGRMIIIKSLRLPPPFGVRS